MEPTYIRITEYCNRSKIEEAFLRDLSNEGLITIHIIEKEELIAEDEINDLERFSTWYYDLGVNVEGIDALQNVVNRLESLNQEISYLRARIRRLEM